jgi:protein ImuA
VTNLQIANSKIGKFYGFSDKKLKYLRLTGKHSRFRTNKELNKSRTEQFVMLMHSYVPSGMAANTSLGFDLGNCLPEHSMHTNLGHVPSRNQTSFGRLRNPLIVPSHAKSAMSQEPRFRRLASTSVQELKARLAAFETRGQAKTTGTLALGVVAIDESLPGGGLARAALHEIVGAANDGAATGFAASILGRLATDGPVLWIARRPDLSAAGLAALGLDPARLLIVHAARRNDALWAFEEALRNPALAAVVAEIDAVDLTQSRRLQLAAEMGGTTALLLRPADEAGTPSAARTRWQIAAEPANGGATLHWRVALTRAQGGKPAAWSLACQRHVWKLADELAEPPRASDRPALSAGRTRHGIA